MLCKPLTLSLIHISGISQGGIQTPEHFDNAHGGLGHRLGNVAARRGNRADGRQRADPVVAAQTLDQAGALIKLCDTGGQVGRVSFLSLIHILKETFGIRLLSDGTIRDTATSDPGVVLDPDAVVSMNFWGFTPEIFDEAQKYFDLFLSDLAPDEIKKEYLLPVLVDMLIKKGVLSVRMLKTDSVWFGVTYREDQPYVERELRRLHKTGVYPSRLWNIKQEERA